MQRDQQFYQIFRASSLIGAASLIGTVVGLLRSKAFALFLGSSGVGLTGLYFNIMQVAAVIACMGVNISVVRELSREGQDEVDRAHARAAGILLALVLGGLCAAGIWIFRAEIADIIVDDPARADEIGWLAAGGATLLIALVFGAVLQGLRRVGEYAFYNAFGAVPGTIAAVLIAWAWGAEAIYLIAICVPLSSTLITGALLLRLPRPRIRLSLPQLGRTMRTLLALGAALMLSVLLQQGAMLYIRAHVTEESGLSAAGFFHAAWVISVVYMALVLQAMGTDFFPRLAGMIENRGEANRAMNQALLVALLLTTPMVIGGIGGAWLVLIIFFSAEFRPASELLMLFSVGNFFRVMSVTLAYTVLSKGWSMVYFGLEAAWALVFLGVATALYDRFGLEAVGIGFILAHGVHFLGTLAISRRFIGFRFAPELRNAILRAVVLCGVTGFAAVEDDWAGLGVGVAAGLISLVVGLSVLSDSVPADSRFGRMLARLGFRPQ